MWLLGGNVARGLAERLLNFIRIFSISSLGYDMVSGNMTYGQIVIVTTLTCNFQPLSLFRTKAVYTRDDEVTPEGTSLAVQGNES